jgi:hypothetical protein
LTTARDLLTTARDLLTTARDLLTTARDLLTKARDLLTTARDLLTLFASNNFKMFSQLTIFLIDSINYNVVRNVENFSLIQPRPCISCRNQRDSY